MSDSGPGDTIKVPEGPDEKGNLDVKSGPPSTSPTGTPSVGGGDTIKAEEPKSGSSTSNPGSKTAGGSLKKGASSKSHLDEIPQEAAQYVEDAARQLGQYILVKQIGKGGMGAVWKAWDKKLTRWVAIKFLLVSEEEDVLRFQREAKLAARLRHPNIAPIYEVGEAPAMQAGQSTRHYLAMEYIDGQTMAGAANLPIPELLDIFMKVAQGIEAAHKAGVVHRDLKPANVMLTSDKWPYVMDFGLAKAIMAESSISVSGAVMGTPAYMPPEQAQGQLDQIDAQSDVYSLGATMYAVFCKKQPFAGQNPMEILMKVCKEDPISMRTHNAEIPEAVEKIVLKAMAKEKADRYPSAQALADDLKRYLSNQEIEAKGPSSLKLAAKKVKRNVWPLVVGALVLVAGSVIGYLVLHKPPPTPVVVKEPADTKPPPVIIKETPVEDPAAKKASEWYGAWFKLAQELDFDDWKSGDATLAERINRHLQLMKTEAPLRGPDIHDWFDRQTTKAETVFRLSGSGEEKRAVASNIVKWYDVVMASAKDIDVLKRQMDSAAKFQKDLKQIASYKGSVTLKILVGPYAEVTRLTTGGKAVTLKDRFGPLMVGGIEIGDLEIEFSHPTLGKRIEKIAAAQLRDGKTYQINGNMKDAKLRVAELP
jgi:serine/threonine protein kinase